MGNGISRCLFEKCLRKRVLSEHLKVIEELEIPLLVALALVFWALLSLLLLRECDGLWMNDYGVADTMCRYLELLLGDT
jgi:hypothetical protein